MEKITVGQFLAFTNTYVNLYIEDEFSRYDCIEGTARQFISENIITEEQKECPIDYIRNVDGGHFGDDEKVSNSIVIGIGIENFEKYFGKEN